MSKQKELIGQLIEVERMLNQLYRKFENLSKEFEGDNFAGQQKLSMRIENQVICLTHELSSTLGFERNKLEALINYFNFRKKYAAFDETILEQIVDMDLSTVQRHELKIDHFIISTMKKEWNDVFDNNSFKKVIAKFQSLS